MDEKHTAAELLEALQELAKARDLTTLVVEAGSRCCGGHWDGNLELLGEHSLYVAGLC